jgi:gliding motility-associated lipoprotein GldH
MSIKKLMKKKIVIFLLISISLFSCGKTTIFEKYEKIENAIWDRNKVITFDVPIKNINKKYNIFIVVRHSEIYPFNNLYIGVDIYTPSGDKRSKDYYLELRNEDRSFKGDGLGEIWDLKVQIMKNVSFTKEGIHKFEISNLMQYPNLPDIMEIGLIVEKHD